MVTAMARIKVPPRRTAAQQMAAQLRPPPRTLPRPPHAGESGNQRKVLGHSRVFAPRRSSTGFPQGSEDLKSRARVTVPGFWTALRVASRR